jgi:hypothetical protein
MFEDKNCHYCGAEYSKIPNDLCEFSVMCRKRNCVVEFAYCGPESRFTFEVWRNGQEYWTFIDSMNFSGARKLHFITSSRNLNTTDIFEIDDFGKRFLFSFDFYIEPISIKQIKSYVLSALKLKAFT